MAEPVTVARTAISAVHFLFSSDENGSSGAQKIIIGIAIGILSLTVIFCAFVESLFAPFLGSSHAAMSHDMMAAKAAFEQEFSRPVIKTGQKGMLSLPVMEATVSSYYGHRHIEGMEARSFHEGLDFPVAFGTPVMAVAPGRVAVCGTSIDYGEYIMLEHKMTRYDKDEEIIEEETFYSFYAHLYKKYVFTGQSVEQGRQIAASGGDQTRHFAGNSTGAHLHLELRRTTEYSSHFDPYEYILNPNPFAGDTKSIGWKTE